MGPRVELWRTCILGSGATKVKGAGGLPCRLHERRIDGEDAGDLNNWIVVTLGSSVIATKTIFELRVEERLRVVQRHSCREKPLQFLVGHAFLVT